MNIWFLSCKATVENLVDSNHRKSRCDGMCVCDSSGVGVLDSAVKLLNVCSLQ